MRDRAVESLIKVGAVLPDSSIADHLVPLIKVMSMTASVDWSSQRVHLISRLK